ncbi:ATP-binding transport protein NatA [Thermoclostridium stercorarium subsp. stercorarium DSM 8532]|jgi:ABC-2 type transport system ATP-binding protein|uniref:ATP-binding transport protein NatA n=1 Tax=Thermoclostridium stercorarium (strain ATCC 35414 / DSM 8532 / NCIMB 11754) TaxID=1121335 RepID=L7VPJ8_THES1|nr:ATP-binding cassette domain-containing protein [Thermoclostridium stercorarium]AGC68702.1 ATP-binding transport protein NatA [Thermoclostridium stercorarium subsp. stercorarium DSM 8532]AGI39711.1 ABC transporter ATPase subunit [Thermoclostridium stercorarium subsp. stercorarium DSM 8532]
MIELININKTFKVSRRNAGLKEAFRSLFTCNCTYIQALHDISFKINDGEMVGYIGPNGAGKSTTVKIMSGILYPDSGECVINGLIPYKNRREHVRNIGVVFGQRSQLWWDVPVIDSFELLKDIYDVDKRVFKNNLEELVELLGLKDIIKTPARQLSLGQRMRCEIAASFLHNPKILFLDEPTIGLDAVSKIAVRSFIKKMNQEKKTTVILTTHDMQDIEALTERILLIGRGQILFDGSLSDMKSKSSKKKKITLHYGKGRFSSTNGISLINQVDGHAVFEIDTSVISVREAIELLSKSADIKDLSVTEASIDEIVVSLYEELGI